MISKETLLSNHRGDRTNRQIRASMPQANKAKGSLSPTKIKSYGTNIARMNNNSRKAAW